MTNRFAAIVTPGKPQRYRVFDRVTRKSYAATDDLELANQLAATYSKEFFLPWYRRLLVFVFRLSVPEPTPDPVEVEPVPEWKARVDRINELCEQRKREMRLVGQVETQNDLLQIPNRN